MTGNVVCVQYREIAQWWCLLIMVFQCLIPLLLVFYQLLNQEMCRPHIEIDLDLCLTLLVHGSLRSMECYPVVSLHLSMMPELRHCWTELVHFHSSIILLLLRRLLCMMLDCRMQSQHQCQVVCHLQFVPHHYRFCLFCSAVTSEELSSVKQCFSVIVNLFCFWKYLLWLQAA